MRRFQVCVRVIVTMTRQRLQQANIDVTAVRFPVGQWLCSV